jgi:hypothetical protein
MLEILFKNNKKLFYKKKFLNTKDKKKYRWIKMIFLKIKYAQYHKKNLSPKKDK